jgi:hypothetical protein
MRLTVKVFSICGFVIHGLFLILCYAASGLSDAGTSSTSHSGWISILMPFVYFVFCFVTSIRRFPAPLLIPGGIIAHIIIVPFYYRAIRDGMGIFAIVPIVLSVCWILMCLSGEKKIR